MGLVSMFQTRIRIPGLEFWFGRVFGVVIDFLCQLGIRLFVEAAYDRRVSRSDREILSISLLLQIWLRDVDWDVHEKHYQRHHNRHQQQDDLQTSALI
jgi:hypothetical protein